METSINEIICYPGSERAILSICIKNKDKLIEAEALNLCVEHFSIPAHRYIYMALTYLVSKPDIKNIDSFTVLSVLDDKAKSEIEKIGGLEYIDALFTAKINDNLKFYCTQVIDAYILRQIYNFGKDIQEKVLSEVSKQDILNEIQTKALNLSLAGQSNIEVYRMGTNISEKLKQRAENPNMIVGRSIGWPSWDEQTQGLKGNELIVIGAPTKTGKSVLLLNWSAALSIFNKDAVPGLYIDTEMDSNNQEDRLLAILSQVPYSEIVSGMYAKNTEYGESVDKIERLKQAEKLLLNSQLYHVYMPDFNINKVTALIRKYRIQYGIEYAVFDYIKMPNSEVSFLNYAQEYQRIGYITTCLKDLAGLCNIPILTAAQTNKQDEIGFLRIMQIASTVCYLFNKTDEEIAREGFHKGNQKLIIKFQRNGGSELTPINILHNKHLLTMKEVS